MSETLETLATLSVLTFVICSMASMGLSLLLSQVLDPLKDLRIVVLALAANFILVPAVAYGLVSVLPVSEPIRIGLILLATAAGAPFLPKLVQIAGGDQAFSVGLMVLLMVVTVVYLPIVLPLLLRGVQVSPWDVAQSLVVLMLLPLALGLLVRARYEDAAASLLPTFSMASNVAIILLIVTGLVLNFSSMISLVGSLGLIAAVIFVAAALAIGYFLGGASSATRSVTGLGAGQRNISAALVVAAQNFDSDVISYLMVVAVIGFVVLFPVAGELGKRQSDIDEGAGEAL